LVAAILLTLFVSACSAETQETLEPDGSAQGDFKQWKLPKRLREISGLALTPDERLLAVTDEKAIVYELDYQEGKIIKSFALGDPTVRADFEGMTSDGLLFAAAEGADGRSVPYQKYDTDHGGYCELEGLAQDRATATLLLVCKQVKSKHDDLMIFEWSASIDGIEHNRDVAVPEALIIGIIDKKRISPSGIAIDPQTGERVLVTARQGALIRLTADGILSEAILLKKKGRHKQAEGIEMTRDGRLLIADEGGGGRARLAVYSAPSRNPE